MKDAPSVLLVYSVNHAIKIEKMLITKKVSCKLVPVPRHLSSDCGICVRFNKADKQAVENIVKDSAIETVGIYDLS